MSHVDIQLSKPLIIAGAEVKALRMREPTVADQITADAAGNTAAAQEVHMFCNLCEISPEDMKRMTLKDYRQLQKAYLGFLD
jgi:hypothetical protein